MLDTSFKMVVLLVEMKIYFLVIMLDFNKLLVMEMF